MNRLSAIEVKQQALEAVECFSRILNSAKAGYSADEMAALHREVGKLIGGIQMGVLQPVYKQFSDLDDLA